MVREDQKERVDRELIELLQELRVALPGVQVLFAFLLTVPFTLPFREATPLQRNVYFLTLMLTAVSSAFLIAPTSYHRLRFRTPDKEQMVFISNRLSIIGLALLAIAMVGVVVLITDVLYGTRAVMAIGTAVALLFAGLWYVLPLTRR